ncbi:MAG TPA: hypothetical protein VLX28_14630 [Thermoanaerobaculia bacterium]|nr:hypothetical protein [Thermoanaerobaculia bacterium]
MDSSPMPEDDATLSFRPRGGTGVVYAAYDPELDRKGCGCSTSASLARRKKLGVAPLEQPLLWLEQPLL